MTDVDTVVFAHTPFGNDMSSGIEEMGFRSSGDLFIRRLRLAASHEACRHSSK